MGINIMHAMCFLATRALNLTDWDFNQPQVKIIKIIKEVM